MLRTSRCILVLLVCGVLTAACHGAPHAPSATGSGLAKPDQSRVFFPGTVDTYALTLTQTDRGTCNLRLTQADSDPEIGSAVVKYGLVAWSDRIIEGIAGQTPGVLLTRSERDGVTLFDFTGTNGPSVGAWLSPKPTSPSDRSPSGPAPPVCPPPRR